MNTKTLGLMIAGSSLSAGFAVVTGNIVFSVIIGTLVTLGILLAVADRYDME